MAPYSKHLSASVMCADQMNLQSEIECLLAAGINQLHCDIMDGIFVNNLAMGPYDIKALNKNKELILDLHLATVEPEKYIHMFAPLKPEYITFHVEVTNNVSKLIELIRSYGIKPGLAYSPFTSNEAVEPYLEEIDLLLAMTVPPGFAGQNFCFSVVDKLRSLFQYANTYNIEMPRVSVDGNIFCETMQHLRELPIDLYVLGTSALFDGGTEDYSEKVERLENQIKQYQ